MNAGLETARIEDHGRIGLIVLGHDYDSGNLRTLAALQQRLLGEIGGPAIGLLVDLGQTASIGCGFLNVLLRCRQRANQMNRRFALCNLNPMPQSVFAITRLDLLWEIFPTRREAIDAIGGEFEQAGRG
jgi:anti-anti-sigma factor